MHLMVVQHAGDYREAYQRLSGGGQENYYAQRYSVDALGSLAQRIESVSVLCCLTEQPYKEQLANGVHAIGGGFQGHFPPEALVKLVADEQPTHLLLRCPNPALLRWAVRNRIPTLVTLAESIDTKGLRNQYRSFRLAHLLNQRSIEWVGGYGLTASRQLQRLGVQSHKIIPWDFLLETNPGPFPAKTLPAAPERTWELLYVGSVIPAKGVGDAIAALAHLRQKQIPARLKIVGRGEIDQFTAQARSLGVEQWVEFAGIIPTDQLEPLMHHADVVLVPSQHHYVEGFPLVIQHALRSRTPLVVSNHPMFLDYLHHGSNAMIFPAGNASALASCVAKLLTHPDLYTHLSAQSHNTWKQLRLPVKWADLIECWVQGKESDRQWLSDHRLTAVVNF